MARSFSYITPQYFAALRIPLLSGRAFTDADTATSQPVAIVNSAFGKHFFDDPNPLGRHIQAGKTAYTIVGVVPDVLDQSNVHRDAPIGTEPIYYVPYTQVSPRLLTIVHMWAQPSWIVRTRGPDRGHRRPNAARSHRRRSRTALLRLLLHAGFAQQAVTNAAHRSDAAGNARRTGAAALGSGHLRAGVESGRAADARDRHPHRPGLHARAGHAAHGLVGNRSARSLASAQAWSAPSLFCA